MDVFIGLSSEASAETLDCCVNTCEVFSVVVMTTRCFMGCLRLLLASALRSSSGSASRRRRHDSPGRDVTCFLVSWWRHLSDRSFSLPLCSSTNQVVRFQSYLKTSLIKIFYWLFGCNMILLYCCFVFQNGLWVFISPVLVVAGFEPILWFFFGHLARIWGIFVSISPAVKHSLTDTTRDDFNDFIWI